MRDTSIAVTTPEQVSVRFQLAGVGTRAIAQLIDIVILLVGYVLVAIGAVAWDWTHVFGRAMPYVVSFLILTGFLVLWAYFIIFESVWSGRTPGKRLIGIRTMSQDGRPAHFFAIVVRNLLRLVDFLPTGYLLGVVVMFLDGRERRIGDLAAGTVVVVDERPVALAPMTLSPASAARDVDLNPSTDQYVVGTKSRKSRHALVIHGHLTDAELALVKTFKQRQRGMSRLAREQLIERVWSQLVSAGGVEVVDKTAIQLASDTPPPLITSADVPVEEKAALLVAVAQSRRTRQFGAWTP